MTFEEQDQCKGDAADAVCKSVVFEGDAPHPLRPSQHSDSKEKYEYGHSDSRRKLARSDADKEQDTNKEDYAVDGNHEFLFLIVSEIGRVYSL